MARGSIHGRLEKLETRAPRPRSRPGARARMIEHLRRVAALRRGELGPEEAAEVEATSAAMEKRMAQMRGEGGR